MKPVKTAVVGCGAISDIYLNNMTRKYAGLDVTACCANHRASAEKKAAQFGIRAASVEEVLRDAEVELMVVLTPPSAHYELVKQALLAGKHVYTEKPISLRLYQAEELLALAEEKRLLLGSAPETFLGSAMQTARQALDAGMIGELTGFHVAANRNISILAGLYKYLRQPGGGICYDYGVYYLTALVSLLGPMREVYARVGNHLPVRKNTVTVSPEYGQDYTYENEAQVNAVLTTAGGVTGTFSLNGDSAAADQGYFTLHGTGGMLRLGDANLFGTEVSYLPADDFSGSWRTLEPVSSLSENCRGVGVAELARCIRTGGAPLASGAMACHVLDIVEQIMESGKAGLVRTVETGCARPAPFAHWKELLR